MTQGRLSLVPASPASPKHRMSSRHSAIAEGLNSISHPQMLLLIKHNRPGLTFWSHITRAHRTIPRMSNGGCEAATPSIWLGPVPAHLVDWAAGFPSRPGPSSPNQICSTQADHHSDSTMAPCGNITVHKGYIGSFAATAGQRCSGTVTSGLL